MVPGDEETGIQIPDREMHIPTQAEIDTLLNSSKDEMSVLDMEPQREVELARKRKEAGMQNMKLDKITGRPAGKVKDTGEKVDIPLSTGEIKTKKIKKFVPRRKFEGYGEKLVELNDYAEQTQENTDKLLEEILK